MSILFVVKAICVNLYSKRECKDQNICFVI
jgi:hypothetical protein